MKNKPAELAIELSRNYAVLCFTESWLNSSIPDSLLLQYFRNDFNVFRSDRKRQEGGGVAIFVRSSISVVVVSKETVKKSHELLALDLNFDNDLIRIICVYKTTACNQADSFIINERICDLCTCAHPSLVLGDFNYSDIEWPCTDKFALDNTSRAFIDMCESTRLQQLVTKVTRIDKINGEDRTLDLVLSNKPELVSEIDVYDHFSVSDHLIIKFTLSLEHALPSYTYRKDFQNANYDLINSQLATIDWTALFTPLQHVDLMYDLLLKVLQKCIEDLVPLIKVSANGKKLPEHVQRLLSDRFSLWQKSINTGSLEDKQKFAKYNKKCKRELDKYNRAVEKKIIESGDRNRFFKHIKTCISSTSGVDALVDENGLVVSDNSSKAELLARSFSTVFVLDNGVLPQVTVRKLPSEPNLVFPCHIICSLIESWRKSACKTPDNLNLSFIKKVAVPISIALEYIFNHSFLITQIPKVWKHSIVTPIKKQPPFSNPLNFRPVSITSFFCRVFEKILVKYLIKFCEKHKLLPDEQYGFRKDRSIELQMLDALEYWTKETSTGRPVDIVYFDYAKAFDRVSHAKLVHKLESIGIPRPCLLWITEYLRNRTFQVRVKDSLSSSFPVTSGVPQGSVLGPLLFLLYTAELPSMVQKNGIICKMFADDLKIYRGFKNDVSRTIMQDAIDAVSLWSNEWQLPIATQKCAVLHLGKNNNKDNSIIYSLNGIAIQAKERVRDLGFIVDRGLTFSSHCRMIAVKARTASHLILRALRSNKKETLLKAYRIYIRSILESSSTVFSPYQQKDIDVLEKVQNYFTRRVHRRCEINQQADMPTSTVRNATMSLKSLKTRRNENDLFVLYKLISGKIQLSDDKNHHFSSRYIGSKFRLFYSTPKSNYRANSFFIRSSKFYNQVFKNRSFPTSLFSLKLSLDSPSS